MPWSPEQYNKFRDVRYLPFYDLVSHLQDKPGMQVIDLGCGTGELTHMLASRLTDPVVKGIDSSAEMLANAPSAGNLHFEQRSIEEQLRAGSRWDLVFSNAALQWVDDHAALVPKLTALLRKGGQLAIQMPCQQENRLNQLLMDLIGETPWREKLGGWRQIYPVLSMDEYAQLLFAGGGSGLQIYQKVYPLIADTHDALCQFIAGSSLIPYLERLSNADKSLFTDAYRQRVAAAFPELPALYAFKRILLYARF